MEYYINIKINEIKKIQFQRTIHSQVHQQKSPYHDKKGKQTHE